MARRSAPPGSGPAYVTQPFGGGSASGGPRGRLHDAKSDVDENENESAVGRFVREQILSPQYIAGNINILTSVAIFGAGVFAIRQWGDVLTVGL